MVIKMSMFENVRKHKQTDEVHCEILSGLHCLQPSHWYCCSA